VAEPYVPIARLTTANTLLTALEASLSSTGGALILADKNAAATNAATAAATEKQFSFSLMLGGA
jgi:hypothetical protein